MRQFIGITLLAGLLQLPAWAHEKSSNALVIQADFAGVVMAGVAYTVSRDLEIFNIRPLIPLYDIAAASESLAYNAQSWPAGTVFVSVVDPGVGTPRKSVVLRTDNDLYFVSPDNGSLSGPAKAYGINAVREIDESVNRIPGSEWSHTFHGRDVYSYTGARLAAGVISFEGVGPLLPAEVIHLPTSSGSFKDGVFTGKVTGGTGRLGNVYFNIDRNLWATADPQFDDTYVVMIRQGEKPIWRGEVPYARSFGSVPVGENLLFINSQGQLALAVNQGNFAKKYGISAGTDWHVEIHPK